MLFLLLLFSFNFALAQSYPLLISEIMYNPEGNDTDREWIEVVNLSNQTFNISTGTKGFRIDDGSKHLFKGTLVVLNPNEVLVIVQDEKKFLTEYPNFTGKIIQANFSLKNETGIIQIYDQNKNLIAKANYANYYGGDGNGYSLIYQNGWRQSEKKGGTPGTYQEANNQNFKEELTTTVTSTTQTTSTNQEQKETNIETKPSAQIEVKINKEIIEPKTLIISEFLPNAEGNDAGKEFVEIYNYGKEVISLEKFALEIRNKKLKLQGNIEPEEYVTFTNKDYNFSIRNSQETLRILYQDETIFEISYQGKAPQGKSFAKINSKWLWTIPTPGKGNIKEKPARSNLQRHTAPNKRTSQNRQLEDESKIISQEIDNSPKQPTSPFTQIKTQTLFSEKQNIYYLLGAIALIVLLFLFSMFKFNKNFKQFRH